jgi:EAL domain-containing protein (putative c-di-GMP-specific phosphodiesterase class I)
VQLALDDVGAGAASLARVVGIDFDVLKIDRSFVEKLDDGGNEAAVVAAVVSLGHGLGMLVVAEGAETHGALDRLRELGCDAVQGFVLSRPVAPEMITAMVATSVVG